MDRSFKHNLIVSQIVLYAALALCLLLLPSALAVNDGLSYFGVKDRTAGLWVVGLIVSAFYLWRAASFDHRLSPVIRRGLKATAILTAGIALTPYSVSNLFDWVHTVLGSALFSLQLLFSIWLCFWIVRSLINFGLLALELAGGILSLIYLAPSHGFLLQTQLMFQMAFSVLLLSNLKVIHRTVEK